MEAPGIRLIERCVPAAADCAAALAPYLLTDARGPPVKATCESPISRPQARGMTLLTIYFFEPPRLDSASWFQNNLPGALLFVRAGGGRRLGGDPHVAPALAALPLGYAAACCSVAFVEPAQFPHRCRPRIPDGIGWHADCACEGTAGRGLLDAGARLSGAAGVGTDACICCVRWPDRAH